MELTSLVLFLVTFIFLTLLLCSFLDGFQKSLGIKDSHVLITGGSSGIGKEVAKEALKSGANVTIVARNVKKLQDTVEELKSLAINGQKIAMLSIDLSEGSSTEIRNKLQDVIDTLGPVKVLVHCAGLSVPGRAHQVSDEDVKKMMDVNYFGSVKMTQALLPDMITNRDGAIIFTSSVAGLVGVYGLAPYCGSKFAVRGYAEALAMELGPFGIKVSVNCPPDTDTPGLEAEEATKPEETKLISEGAGLFQPEVVARTLLQGGLNGQFLTSNGMDGWLSVNLAVGMGHSSYKDLFVQAGLLGLMRVIAFGYLQYFRFIIHRCHKRREATKKIN